MNKKILLSVAAAATLAMTFTGCGSSDSTAATAPTTVDGVVLIDGVEYGASAGKLTGATVTVGTDGLLTVTGGKDKLERVNGTIKGHTVLGRNTNAFTNMVSDVPSTLMAGQFTAIATAFGIDETKMKGIFGVKNKEDSIFEGYSILIEGQLSANKLQSSPADLNDLLNTMASATPGQVGAMFKAMKAQTGSKLDDTEIDGLVALVIAGTRADAINSAMTTIVNERTADSDYAVQTVTTLVSDYITANPLTGIILDNNTTVADNNSTISTMTLSGADMVGGTYDNNETGTMLISLTNLDGSGQNDNASYAVKLTSLIPVASGDTNGSTISGFTFNTNTSLTVTANSNMSKAITLNDQNVTRFFDTCGVVDGMDINVTAFTSYISTLVHAEEVSETFGENATNVDNGNFTAGMDTNDSTFGLKVLVDINGNDILSSDSAWLISTDTINIGADSETATAGTVNSGYKVIDSNITK